VKIYALIVTLIILINGTCFAGILDESKDAIRDGEGVEKIALCNDMESVIKSLRIQRYDASVSGLLNSLGVRVLMNHGLHLVGVTRISGYCASHIDEFRDPIIHLDTGITLMIDQGQVFPYSKKYYPRFFVGANDAYPEIPFRKFIQAIDIGGGHREQDIVTEFIGAWTQDEKSIITPYRKLSSGIFHFYDDLLELDKVVLGIRFLHHLDTPSGLIQILQRDGGDRILLEFIWVYGDLFLDKIH